MKGSVDYCFAHFFYKGDEEAEVVDRCEGGGEHFARAEKMRHIRATVIFASVAITFIIYGSKIIRESRI